MDDEHRNIITLIDAQHDAIMDYALRLENYTKGIVDFNFHDFRNFAQIVIQNFEFQDALLKRLSSANCDANTQQQIKIHESIILYISKILEKKFRKSADTNLVNDIDVLMEFLRKEIDGYENNFRALVLSEPTMLKEDVNLMG